MHGTLGWMDWSLGRLRNSQQRGADTESRDYYATYRRCETWIVQLSWEERAERLHSIHAELWPCVKYGTSRRGPEQR